MVASLDLGPDPGLEERLRDTGVQRRTGANLDGHNLSIRRNIEELSAVASPPGLPPAPLGNLAPLARPGKAPDKDFELARFLGLVREPSAVGGEARALFIEEGLEQRAVFPALQVSHPTAQAAEAFDSSP